MASVDAAINVVVRGQAELDRVIGKINQLDGLIQSVRSTPLDLSAGKSESRILDLSASVSGYETKLKSVRGQLKSLDSAVDNYIDQIKKQQDAQRSLTAGTAAYSNIQQKIEKNQKALSVAHASLAVKAEEEERILRKLAATRRELGRAQGANEQIAFLNQLADSYVKLGDARRITKTGFSTATGDNALAGNRITNAQLKAQVALLRQVADNVELGSQKYREFTIAADVASRKLAASARSSFNILAEAYSAEAPQTNFGRFLGAKDIAGARKQVNDLISAFAKIAPSEAGLGAYRAELESLRSVVPIASAEFNKLGAAIEEVDKALAKARPMVAVPETRQGPAIELGSVQASREQLRYDKAILEARQNLQKVSTEIDNILTSQSEKDKLRKQIGEGFLALDQGRLEVARKIARETQADARISRRDFKDKQIQSDRTIKLQNKIIEQSKEAEAAVKKLEAIQAGAYDNSDLADFLETQKQIGAEYASQNKAGDKAGRLWQQQLDSAAALPGQLRKLQTIQNNYNRAKEKGAKFSQQEEELLSGTIAKLSDPAFTAKAGTRKAVGDIIRQFESIRRLRISEVPTGARGTGDTAIKLEERRSRLLENALKLQGQIQTLEGKGASVASEKLSLEQRILEIKNLQGKATQSEIEILAAGLQDIRTGLQGAKNVLQDAISAEGFAASFQKLKTSLATSRGFFEGTDPRTAINDIYKQFAKAPSSATSSPAQQASENIVKTFADALKSGGSRAAAAATVFSQSATKAIKKVFGIASPSRFMIEIVKTLADTYVAEMQRQYPRIQAATDKAFGEQTLLRNVKELRATGRGFEFVERPSRGFRPFRMAQGFGRGTEGATQEFNNMMLDFRKQIAELTTQPEIFSNLLRGLPDDRITTDLIGAANRRALASELPSFMSTQRMLGPGELEKAITSAFSKFVRELRVPASERIRSERFAGPKLLPPATEIITPSQQERIVRAYERSAQRALSVLAEDAFRGIGRQSLPAANFGFMADPARLARLSPVLGNRLLPPAIDVTANAVDGATSAADQGRNRLREAVSGLFSRLQGVISGAMGGGAGGGFFGGRGGGGGGTPPMPPGDGGDDAIPPNIRKLSINQLELFAGSLAEVRARLEPTAADFDRLDKELRDLIGSVQREQQRRDPNADFLTRRFGPRSANAISEGLIGGAFPLLFGQGLGASVGGGVGGAAGGFLGGGLGFGLSLIGTALGTAFDTAVQSAIELGAALTDTSKSFDTVKDRSLFSSKEAEKLASKLQEYGFVASASAAAQQEIINKIGGTGVASLTRLGDSSDKLARAWSELNLQLQSALAGPMAGLLDWVAEVVGVANRRGRTEAEIQDVFTGLPSEKQASFLDKFQSDIQSIFSSLGPAVLSGGSAFGGPLRLDPSFEADIFAAKQKIADEFKDQVVTIPGRVKLSEEQVRNELLAAYSKQLEAIDVAKPFTDQVRNAAREQQDLDRQRADLVRSYEESIGNIRKRIEDEIANRRFSILEKENQLLDLQGQNRIKRLEIENQRIVALAGAGERDEVASVAREVAQIVADFTEQQLSAEEEAAKIKRDAALDARKFDFESLKFKADIEKEVAKLNIDTARRVSEINETIRRRNEDTDTRRFEIERAIAVIKAKQLTNELAALTFRPEFPQIFRDALEQNRIALDRNIAALQEIEPPQPLRQIGGVGGLGVSTGGLDARVSQERDAIRSLVDEALKGIDITSEGARNALRLRLGTVIDNIDKSLSDIETRESDAEVARLRRIELINAGLTDGVAQRVIELEQVRKVALAQYDIAIAQLESKIVNGDVTGQVAEQNRLYLEQIELIRRRKDALEGRFGGFDAGTGTGTGVIGETVTSQKGREIQDFITSATEELNNLEAVAVRVSQGIGDAVGNSLSSAIIGLTEGTTTAKEVFAGFLRDVGQILIQEATKMIATYVAIGIAKMFAGLSSGFSAGSSGATNAISKGKAAFAIPAPSLAANGAYFANGVAAFANGGAFTNSIVKSPTLFQFADGGALKTGVMGEAGPEAIMPLQRGADGRLGVQASGLREAMGAGPAGSSGAPVLNMSFETTTIGGVEYVSREQLEQAMAETRRAAANDGAKRGMTMTLDRIQNSSSTRRRIGV